LTPTGAGAITMPIDPFASLTELAAALAHGSASALELAALRHSRATTRVPRMSAAPAA
jgi:hypothetical protein